MFKKFKTVWQKIKIVGAIIVKIVDSVIAILEGTYGTAFN
jgi:hypothetical protein